MKGLLERVFAYLKGAVCPHGRSEKKEPCIDCYLRKVRTSLEETKEERIQEMVTALLRAHEEIECLR